MISIDITDVLLVILTIVIGVTILIIYRNLVSDEYEPIPVAFTLVGLVDVLIVFGFKEQETRGILAVPLVLFFLYAIMIVAIFQRQRKLKNKHIERVLKKETHLLGVPPSDPEVSKWIEAGKSIITVDIFPNNWLETNLGGTRQERREIFYSILPSPPFNKKIINPNMFIIPPQERRNLQILYILTSTFSFITLIWVIFFLTF